MKSILAASHARWLQRFASGDVMLGFDFDGTLAPLVRDRDAVRVRPKTARLFSRVSELYPTVVVSGRSRDDVRQRVAGAQLLEVVGNHGLEPGHDLERYARLVSAVLPRLRLALAREPGVEIEVKRYSLTVHYRKSRAPGRAIAAVTEAVSHERGRLRVVPGHLVLNLVPTDAPHKGKALEGLLRRFRHRGALFVGDDVTDEDAFASPLVTGVRVGRTTRSSAAWFVESQADVDALLEVLAAARLRPSRPGR